MAPPMKNAATVMIMGTTQRCPGWSIIGWPRHSSAHSNTGTLTTSVNR